MPLGITIIILVFTCIISLMAFNNRALFNKLIFNPFAIQHSKEWYRFLTGGIIHADFLHLAVNMFVLYSFGGIVEMYYAQVFGENAVGYFLMLYVGGLLFSVLPTYNRNKDNFSYNGLGASGAVSAVVFSFILFDPMQKLCLYGLLCLPGIIFGVLYLVYCYYMNKKGGSNVNHDAHMWGAVFGFCFTILLKPTLFLAFVERLLHFRDAI